MSEILITPGNPNSNVGGKLNHIALDYMTHTLVGTRNSSIIEHTLNSLWKSKSNRFSHEYAFEAKIDTNTVGMVTCYPVSVMNKLAVPTINKLLKLRKWDLIKHSILNLGAALSIVDLKEGRNDEYHIGAIATLPESRGYGIGSKLIDFAENQARLNNYKKCSLTVKKENTKALKLYKNLGYEVVDFIEKEPYHLYRMVKNI